MAVAGLNPPCKHDRRQPAGIYRDDKDMATRGFDPEEFDAELPIYRYESNENMYIVNVPKK